MAEGGSFSSTAGVDHVESGTWTRDTVSTAVSITGVTGGKVETAVTAGVIHGGVHVQSDRFLQELEDATVIKVKEKTRGMIRVSAVDMVKQKLTEGSNWVTITGNAGEGKTTLGYLVLQVFIEQGYTVFKVDTPNDLIKVLMKKVDGVVMLNDIFGAFTLDALRLSKWITVLEDIHKTTTVIFISRRHIIEEAKNHLDRLTGMFTDECVLDLSSIRNEQERLQLLECHLSRGHIQVDEFVKLQVVTKSTAHGFPHCCKIFVDLMLKGEHIDIMEFFMSPLQFLNQMTKVLIEDPGTLGLFKEMCKGDGTLDISSLTDGKDRVAITKLIGTYLTMSSTNVQFSHPSIYESVITAIGETYPVFFIRHAILSVILQKVNLIQTEQEKLNGFVNLCPAPQVLNILCERLRPHILHLTFGVFGNTRICGNVDFLQKLMQCSVFKRKTPLRRFTKQRVYINTRDAYGHTMLHTAIRGGNYAAIPVLLYHGANVNVLDWFGESPLHVLCRKPDADADTMKMLIKSGADVNKADCDGRTVLRYLCETGKCDASIVDMLIKHGADVNKYDKFGKTGLHYMCEIGNVDANTIEMWIQKGADVNQTDSKGRTAIHYLCAGCNSKELPDVEVKENSKFDTVRRHYLSNNDTVDVSIVGLLIKYSVDLNKSDVNGMAPIHYLCASGRADVQTIQLFISHGADVNKRDRNELQAYHHLCLSGKARRETLHLLAKQGADVNAEFLLGDTEMDFSRFSLEDPSNTAKYVK